MLVDFRDYILGVLLILLLLLITLKTVVLLIGLLLLLLHEQLLLEQGNGRLVLLYVKLFPFTIVNAVKTEQLSLKLELVELLLIVFKHTTGPCRTLCLHGSDLHNVLEVVQEGLLLLLGQRVEI